MASVKWTHQALDDLEAICLFIARDASKVAAVFASRAFEATDRLADHPRLGRVVPEFQTETIREVILHSYRLIYRIVDDEVHVLTVHHGARLLSRDDLESS
jgi:addiction module RelE/StbE family toxin